MGIRLLLIILALGALYLVVRKYLVRARKTPVNRQKNVAENMVRCEVCGTFLPEREALKRGTLFYCSREHLDQASRDKP